MTQKKTSKKSPRRKGRLKIGDSWNAITIIAMSQSNPLKAIAEFVENSIDAQAKNITIIRGKEKNEHYLKIIDDGEGIRLTGEGVPDFAYVATHICDSIKKEMKEKGIQGIQGEFGIGLLSFWTVGEELKMTSAGGGGRNYQMIMKKEEPGYVVQEKRSIMPVEGVEMTIKPLLPGVRQLSGEKIQWYLASELRDRIRSSGVQVKIIDRRSRKEFVVEPREFSGRLLHNLGPVRTPLGDIYIEIYLDDSAAGEAIGLYRSGTRIMEDISQLDPLSREPWTSPALQGIIDVPFVNLTPGTRSGVIHDEALQTFYNALAPIEESLQHIIDEQRRAEEERASARILRSVQKALKEALMTLPPEEYDWFDVHGKKPVRHGRSRAAATDTADTGNTLSPSSSPGTSVQKQFFEYAGPLYSVRISPQSCVLPVNQKRSFRAVARDKSKKQVEDHLAFSWHITEGSGEIASTGAEIAQFTAGSEPGLVKLLVTATQNDITCEAEALITVTKELIEQTNRASDTEQGIPGYTYKKAPGELWRSYYDEDKNVIVINNGHRDFVYASKNKALKVRYISRLFAKELICKNFKGTPPPDLLERMIELTLYMEQNL